MADTKPACPACGHYMADITERTDYAPKAVQCSLCGNEGLVLGWKLITSKDEQDRPVQRIGVEVKWKIPRFYLTPDQIAVMKELLDE